MFCIKWELFGQEKWLETRSAVRNPHKAQVLCSANEFSTVYGLNKLSERDNGDCESAALTSQMNDQQTFPYRKMVVFSPNMRCFVQNKWAHDWRHESFKRRAPKQMNKMWAKVNPFRSILCVYFISWNSAKRSNWVKISTLSVSVQSKIHKFREFHGVEKKTTELNFNKWFIHENTSISVWNGRQREYVLVR